MSPPGYYQASTKLFPLLYGKTIIIFITSFSQYTTICFVSFFFIRFSMNNFETLFEFLVGPSGLEPPTSCLSGTRSNLLSYEPMWLVWLFTLGLQCREQISLLSHCVGIELSSRAASSKVFSPLQSLTSVFGMGTGGPSAFVTPTISVILHH